MVRIVSVSAELLEGRRRRRSPEAEAQIQQFRELIGRLRSSSDAYLVSLDAADKPGTVRARLTRTADAMGVAIMIKKHPDGFVVGLKRPGRASGSRRATQTGPNTSRVRLNLGPRQDAN